MKVIIIMILYMRKPVYIHVYKRYMQVETNNTHGDTAIQTIVILLLSTQTVHGSHMLFKF